LEELIPDVLRISQNDGNKLRCFITRGVALDLLGWLQLGLLLGINQCGRIAPEEQVSDYEDDSSDSAPEREAPTARAPDVLNVLTFPSSLPEHYFIGFGLRHRHGCLREKAVADGSNELATGEKPAPTAGAKQPCRALIASATNLAYENRRMTQDEQNV
jgi:hypothetical protein